MDDLDGFFDDHASLSASLEDFAHDDAQDEPFQSPLIPSMNHSGFASRRSEEPPSEASESAPNSPWPSEGWRRRSFVSTSPGGMWMHHQPYHQKSVRDRLGNSQSPSKRARSDSPAKGKWTGSPARASRESSPLNYESAEEGDITLTSRVNMQRTSPLRHVTPALKAESPAERDFARTFDEEADMWKKEPEAESSNNYIRFAVRAEVQHQTEPFELAFAYFRDKFDNITKSRSSTLLAVIVGLFSISFLRMIFQTPQLQPVPDLVKVAGLAKSFEPLIFYSENRIAQLGELQETGVAVWDLGESVRATNMTLAPMIVEELDGLSDNLKILSVELTKFFASVDGDVDGILIVMDWAKRELTQVNKLSINTLTSAFENIHAVFCRLGVFETENGISTSIGRLFTDLFGQTRAQRTHRTLQRTFNEFLSVMEDSINAELTHSIALFDLFESIDRQFLNLARTVVREFNAQEREEGELLSSLWTRVLGPNAAQLRKYEKNRKLLSSVRDKTVRNKHVLIEHNGKLLALKASLETLRKKLVSPLVRGNGSSTLSIEEQIIGLDGTYLHLKNVREQQKSRVMEMIYGAGARRTTIGRDESIGIER